MNGTRNHKLEKPFPGCLGRMVNLFDFSEGMARNRLLTDQPHYDGSSQVKRNHADVSRFDQFGDPLENKIVPEPGRNCSKRKSNGTPMKILIAHEMSKELHSRSNPPNVVAKLMGLDALPQGQPDSTTQKTHHRDHSRSKPNSPLINWHQDKGYRDLEMKHELYQNLNPDEYKDVYEILQQTEETNCTRNKSPCKARSDKLSDDRKMALVRQKFIEAKRLSTDEKLRQTPQFEDALEVLNSNKDLFLKFLQEPNSVLPQHLRDMQSIPPQPETKTITVLKPCKMFDNAKFPGLAKKNEKQLKKGSLVCEVNGPHKYHLGPYPPSGGWGPDENPSQPTRIVVLKPSSCKPPDTRSVVSPLSLSPRILHNEELVEKIENTEAQKSREVAKEITRQMSENLSSHRRDETLLSSVFSNGYIGDESSFHKSENEYIAGNLSDLELSPASRHSWDYVNRFDSLFSTSSFSRASYSPESAVCREAKKRLSERWSAMTSGGNHQEQRHVRRNSSTLGEMLALSDTKSATLVVDEGSRVDSEDSPSAIVHGSTTDDSGKSPISLVRSKSVPAFSTVFGTTVDIVNEGSKTDILPETSKGIHVKSSLKGKVSSLFFSRRKRNQGKPTASQSIDEPKPAGMPIDSTGRSENDRTLYVDVRYQECSSPVSVSLDKVASSELSGYPSTMPTEAALDVTKKLRYGNASGNQDQPSPISVLETPFEEGDRTATESSENHNPEHGALLVHSKCNLIDKSPPVGAIARTLSWDDPLLDTAISYPVQSSLSSETAEEEEREWFSYVEALLSESGLDGEIQSNALMARWHSSDSPLDPSLRNKYIDSNDKEALHESKRRQRRSTRKLVFDCVNAALLDIAGYGSETCQRAIPCPGPQKNLMNGVSLTMSDQVWSRIREWFSGEERCVAGDCEDGNCLVVERVVRKAVVGKGWMEQLRLETDNIGVRIELELLVELLQEVVVEFSV